MVLTRDDRYSTMLSSLEERAQSAAIFASPDMLPTGPSDACMAADADMPMLSSSWLLVFRMAAFSCLSKVLLLLVAGPTSIASPLAAPL